MKAGDERVWQQHETMMGFRYSHTHMPPEMNTLTPEQAAPYLYAALKEATAEVEKLRNRK